MVAVVYFSPTIPSVRSTVRYAHADAVPRHVDRATLVTESEPPAAVADRYNDVVVLDGGVLGNARRAKRVAEETAGDGQTLFLTTFHYAPALAGTLADLPWVVDVFDNPRQYAYNNPDSYHRVSARALVHLVDRADGVVHDYHHSGPVLGRDPRFVTEGCPTDLVDPTFEAPGEELQCVWAGSPQLDRGMDTLVEALATLDEPVSVDVYGDADDGAIAYARRHGVTETVTFHGRTEHEEVCEAVGEAHVGLCVLPGRPDWRHSSPLKIREYMAGGTIPVCSDFPGMRLTAESAAVYTDPEPTALASTLDRLFEIARDDPERFVRRMRTCRERAEARPLDVAGEWFVRQAVSSGLGVELF
jgi:glycosyltransferase involved in cell wall biosynthesis